MTELDCYGCGATKDESQLTAVQGKGNRSPRHFCSPSCFEAWSGVAARGRFDA